MVLSSRARKYALVPRSVREVEKSSRQFTLHASESSLVGFPVQAPPARGELQNAPDEVYEGYDYEGYERSHEARRTATYGCAEQGKRLPACP